MFSKSIKGRYDKQSSFASPLKFHFFNGLLTPGQEERRSSQRAETPRPR